MIRHREEGLKIRCIDQVPLKGPTGLVLTSNKVNERRPLVRKNVGAQVVDQLHDDHQLGWQFMGEDEAREAVLGEVYAAIIIPRSFSPTCSASRRVPSPSPR